ncbi:MAG: SdrD B-like domain-containing protein, partial [Clostridia bacterium]
MPNVNGYVAYNGTHTPIITTGIKNVPVALYSTTTGLCAVALTDATGLYQFTNVPAGNYNIIESWGTAALASPVNYAINAIAMSQPPEVEPPLSALSFAPPANADALDAVTPNLLNVVVASTDITNKNFIDGPVGNKPLTISGFSMVGSNLITAADNGTIGTFPAGTAVFTTNPTAPYPSVTPGFTYTTNTVPSDGFYTVMNTSQTVGPWWGVSDHTTGIETGRYMLVNGANPGAVIFTQNVPVTPNADYLLSAWILNLINSNGYAKPQIGLQVLGSDGSVIFLHKLNDISASNI